MKNSFHLFFPLFLLSCSVSFSQALLRFLPQLIQSEGFNEYREKGKKEWKKFRFIPANFTSFSQNVATNLLTGGGEKAAIAYFSDSLRWTEKKDWEFRSVFTLKKNHFSHYKLLLGGVDCFADVFLNGKLVGKCRNSFSVKEIDISPFIHRKGSNELMLVIHSPVKTGKKLRAGSKINYPADNEEGDQKISPLIRKPPYEFGWDITPPRILSGPGEGFGIKGWNDLELEDLFIRQDSISEKFAKVSFCYTLNAEADQEIKLSLPGYGIIRDTTINVKQGKNNIALPFSIHNPVLWWPNSLRRQKNIPAAQSPYGHSCFLAGKNDTISEVYEYYLRKVKLVREKDVWGESFYFEVNGEPVFIKGANYVPQCGPVDLFGGGTDGSQRLIDLLEKTNCNMLRVWGGGKYESEEFYDLCDRMGIMIWQDFMFSGTMYPSDSSFIDNVGEEIETQVKRLRRHPCIALWCGNNEIEVAWKNWGWQKKYRHSKADSIQLITGYKLLFREKIPGWLSVFDPGASYISSSPLSNWGKPEDFTAGDNHYWGVWHGNETFEAYRNHIPRFMSEYGFPSYPSLETIRKYINDIISFSGSPELKKRMRSYKGSEQIFAEIKNRFGAPKDLASFINFSQLAQADAYRMAIESHRCAKPFCMGTLFWQLTDAWPSISWSTLNYGGKPKLAQPIIEKAYLPLLVCGQKFREELKLFLVSDFIKDTLVSVRITTMNMSGKLFSDTTLSVFLKANESKNFLNIPMKALLKFTDEKNLVVRLDALLADRHYDNIIHFAERKDQALKKASFQIKYENGYSYLHTDMVARDVSFSCQSCGKNPEEVFDLLPGFPKRIEVSHGDKTFFTTSYLDRIR